MWRPAGLFIMSYPGEPGEIRELTDVFMSGFSSRAQGLRAAPYPGMSFQCHEVGAFSNPSCAVRLAGPRNHVMGSRPTFWGRCRSHRSGSKVKPEALEI
jgi:hypothetical protein